MVNGSDTGPEVRASCGTACPVGLLGQDLWSLPLLKGKCTFPLWQVASGLLKKSQAGGMTLHDVISARVLFIKVLAGTAFRSLKWCVGNLSAPVFFAVPEAEIEKRKKETAV